MHSVGNQFGHPRIAMLPRHLTVDDLQGTAQYRSILLVEGRIMQHEISLIKVIVGELRNDGI